jgi:hypothetical protein
MGHGHEFVYCKVDAGTAWVSKDCNRRALCVPSAANAAANASFCDCTFTADVLLNKDPSASACKPSIATYFLFSFWILTVVFSLFLTFLALTSVFRARQKKVLRQDTLGFASTLTAGACATMAITNLLRAINLLVFDDSTHELIESLYVAFQAAFSAFTVASLIFFGLSVMQVVVKAANLQRTRQQSRKTLVISVFLGLAVLGGVVPLLLFSQYGLASLFVGVWGVTCWAIFNHVTKKLAPIRASQTNLPSLTTLLLLEASKNILSPLVLFQISSAAYVILWYVGRSIFNAIMLGPISMVAVIIQFGSMLAQEAIVVEIIDRLFQARELAEMKRLSLRSMEAISKPTHGSIPGKTNAIVVFPDVEVTAIHHKEWDVTQSNDASADTVGPIKLDTRVIQHRFFTDVSRKGRRRSEGAVEPRRRSEGAVLHSAPHTPFLGVFKKGRGSVSDSLPRRAFDPNANPNAKPGEVAKHRKMSASSTS